MSVVMLHPFHPSAPPLCLPSCGGSLWLSAAAPRAQLTSFLLLQFLQLSFRWRRRPQMLTWPWADGHKRTCCWPESCFTWFVERLNTCRLCFPSVWWLIDQFDPIWKKRRRRNGSSLRWKYISTVWPPGEDAPKKTREMLQINHSTNWSDCIFFI